ncbi:SRR [Symbiodinium necroappetens]|uniref:SRR protein n=1 Tax=Symbiodinium necroappetens TaxID=1628268 RepID=A0A812R5E0_9DINO|nr:SRR [Symbiodinium necroappetens]
MNATRVRHLENALNLFDKTRKTEAPALPLDLFLRRYFQAHKFLDEKDRAWIADKTYEMHRWRGLIDHLTPQPHNWAGIHMWTVGSSSLKFKWCSTQAVSEGRPSMNKRRVHSKFAVPSMRSDYIVTQSSGNHAQAIALGSKLLGKKAIVVMPEDSPNVKVSAVRDTYGAEVRFCRPTQEAREAMSAETVADLRQQHGADKAEEIHPNQDIRVVNGQGSVALELLEQQPDLDAIVVSIGGGGLISGIATYVKSVNKAIKVIGAEPERARSAFMSKQAGKLVKNPPNTVIDTIADSVKSSLGPTTYPVVQDLVDDVFTATEQEIEDATKFTLERAKQVIEPGCGVAVAVATSKQLYDRYPELQKIGVVLCGGNVDLDNLPWRK